MPSLVDGWCNYQAMRGFSPKTISRRRWAIGKLIDFLGPDPIEHCTSDKLEAWLCRYPVIQTRYTLRSDAHQFFTWGIKRGLIATDPTLSIEPPRLRKRLPTPVATVDIQRLIEHAVGDPLAMILIGCHAGLRVSETAALTDRDIQDGCIHVRSGKGARDRSVPLADEIARALPCRRGELFPGLNGQAVSHQIRTQMRKLDIDHRPHDLRHAFGTELARRGTPIEVIAQLMGHESLATTKGYILLAAPSRSVVEGMFRRDAA